MATLALSFASVHVRLISIHRERIRIDLSKGNATPRVTINSPVARKKKRLPMERIDEPFSPWRNCRFHRRSLLSPIFPGIFSSFAFHESRHEIGQTRTYISISVPRNLLFTNSLFEEYHGVTSAYHFMTTRVRSRATRISAAMGVVDIGLTAIDRKYIRDVELCREEREQCRPVVYRLGAISI